MSEGSQDRVGIVDRDHAAAVRALERCLGGTNPILVSDKQDYRMGSPAIWVDVSLLAWGSFTTHEENHIMTRGCKHYLARGAVFAPMIPCLGNYAFSSSPRSIKDVPLRPSGHCVSRVAGMAFHTMRGGGGKPGVPRTQPLGRGEAA